MYYDFFSDYANQLVSELKQLSINIDVLITDYQKNTIKDLNDLYNAIKLVVLFNDCSYNALQKISKTKAKNTISFTTKFLHFHLPNYIYILDSYSLKFASFLCKNERLNKDFKYIRDQLYLDGIYQKKYEDLIKHFVKCWYISKNVDPNNKQLSPRDVDNYLIREMFK